MLVDIPNNDINIFESLTAISTEYQKPKEMFTQPIGYFVNDYITPYLEDQFSFVKNPYFNALNKINELLYLKDNWDGYQAVAIASQAANNSKAMLNCFNENIIENISDIFPNPHGTITFEWENKEDDKMSLEVGSNTYSYFVTYSNKTPILVNGQDIISSLGEITKEINNVVSSKEA